MELEVEFNEEGEANFLNQPQGVWSGENPEVRQTARLVGQEMVALKADSGAFELHYLGLCTSGFDSMEHAKLSAPSFAQSVFDMLRQIFEAEAS